MDVHSINYTLCAMEPTIGSEDRIFGEVQVAPDYKAIICFIETLKIKLGFYDDYSISLMMQKYYLLIYNESPEKILLQMRSQAPMFCCTYWRQMSQVVS